MRSRRWAAVAGIGVGLAIAGAAPREAGAFCGFYVGGADTKLFNNATMVVLMREGTRTVLSMQNNYQGPPADFALVVPVPVVLQKENVKTLPREVFDHVDALAAPRLVEYWEQDPCPKAVAEEANMPAPAPPAAAPPMVALAGRSLGVRIEAQFTVGEYEVVVLSAQDSTGLDTWLRQNRYKIPEGAEPILRPYVQGGMKFFVAKVDVKKVRFEGGMAMLSPLRFHYDSESFSLPVRLGLLNSAGTQDLIVHVLARGKRYEVSNYPSVTIPTNYDVAEGARDQFGAFYAALFDRAVAEKPGAVVTEYSWDSSSCDPCPTPPLEASDVVTLGADVLQDTRAEPPPPPRLQVTVALGDVTSGNTVPNAPQVIDGLRFGLGRCFEATADGKPAKGSLDVTIKLGPGGRITEVKTGRDAGLPRRLAGCAVQSIQGARFDAKAGGTVRATLVFDGKLVPQPAPPPRQPGVSPYGFVLTRLHARYGKDALGQDLVFREAPPLEGGREAYGVPHQEHGAKPSSTNNFQARYAIRHPWTGAIECANPQRGVWGGPPAGVEGSTAAKPALKVAFAPRGQVDLVGFFREDAPELKIVAPPAPASGAAVATAAPVEPGARGCGSCGVGGGEGTMLPCSIAAFLALLAHDRRRGTARGLARPLEAPAVTPYFATLKSLSFTVKYTACASTPNADESTA